MIYADVELMNGEDVALVRRQMMDDQAIRRMSVTMLVHTGALMMGINERLQAFFNLPVTGRKRLVQADGSLWECDVVAPLTLNFGNRTFTGSALVLPGDGEPFIGLLPMQEMDVVVLTTPREMVVNPEHPELAQLPLKTFTHPKQVTLD